MTQYTCSLGLNAVGCKGPIWYPNIPGWSVNVGGRGPRGPFCLGTLELLYEKLCCELGGEVLEEVSLGTGVDGLNSIASGFSLNELWKKRQLSYGIEFSITGYFFFISSSVVSDSVWD